MKCLGPHAGGEAAGESWFVLKFVTSGVVHCSNCDVESGLSKREGLLESEGIAVDSRTSGFAWAA